MIRCVRFSFCLLVILCIFLHTCFAEGTNQKWQLISTTVINGQMVNFFIDSQSYKIDENPDRYIDCWIKSVTEKGSIVQHFSVKMKDLTYLIEEYIIYDENGNQIENGVRQRNGWKKSSSYSKIELVLMDIFVWAEKENKENADKKSTLISTVKERVYSRTKTNMYAQDLSLIGPVKQITVTSPSESSIPYSNSRVFKFSKKALLTEMQEWKNDKLIEQTLYDELERVTESYSFSSGYKKRMNTFIYDDRNKQYTRFSSNSFEKGALDDYGNIATTEYGEGEGEGEVFERCSQYDANGRVIQKLEGSVITDIEYDSSGRIIKESGKPGKIRYEYDIRGYLIKYIRNLNTIPTLVLTYTEQEIDNYGNWIRRLVNTEFDGVAEPTRIQTRIIEYY